ncbi:hypothetical protein D9M71_708620 [compost metagenome]
MSQGFAGVDRLATTDCQDHVEGKPRRGLAQGGDAVGGDLTIEGDVVQLDVGAGAGGVQTLLDQADDETVDDHHGAAAAMGQVLACLIKYTRALHVAPGRSEYQIHTAPLCDCLLLLCETSEDLGHA